MMVTAKLTCEVGALLRRPVRQSCLVLGLTYQEEKGFLDSVFVVEGPVGNVLKFKHWLNSVGENE